MVTDIGSSSDYTFYLKDQTPDYALYAKCLDRSAPKFKWDFPPKTDKQYDTVAESNSVGFTAGKHIGSVTLPDFYISDGSEFTNMLKALQQWNEDNDLLDLYVKDDTGTANLAVYKNSSDSMVMWHVRVLRAEFEPVIGGQKTRWRIAVKRFTT